MAKQSNTITIDVHGYLKEEAISKIKKDITMAPKTIEKVIVIHGYNNGTVLKDAIKRMHSPRILEICPSFSNEGETIIWLKRN